MRVLLVGLFALVLVTQAFAATTKADATPAPRAGVVQKHKVLTLDQRLDLKIAALHKYRGTVRFFENRRSLLATGQQRSSARSSLAYARSRVRQLTRTVSGLRRIIAARKERRLASLPPKAAICSVFGSYCQEAIAVAWCESRHSTSAQNGQYLGLFQMGSSERRIFGHGSSARAQALAAHRYFVRSGRDWSPWACRWAAS